MRKRVSSTILLGFALCLLSLATFSQLPPGGYGPSTGGSSSGGTLSGGSVIDVTQSPYNVKTGFLAFDCSWTNLLTTVTCVTTTFTSAMNGWIVFGTNGCCGAQNLIGGTTTLPQGTVTFVSAHQITVSVAANATTIPAFTGGSVLAVGPDMTTQLAAAWTAATAGPNCLTLQLPSLPVFTLKGQFTGTPVCQLPLSGGNTSARPDRQSSVNGWSPYNSLLVLPPNFDYTTGAGNSCGGGSTNDVCFGGSAGMKFANWGITGAATTTGTHTVKMFAMTNDSLFNTISCLGIGANDSQMIGVSEQDGFGQGIIYSIFDGCGGQPLNVAANAGAEIVGSFFGDSQAGAGFSTNVNGLLFSSNSAFTNNSANNQVVTINNGGRWTSTNDQIQATGTGNAALFVNTGGVAHVDGLEIGLFGSALAFGINTQGGTTYVANSKIQGATNSIAGASGTVYDLGGNELSSAISLTGTAKLIGSSSFNNAIPTISSGFGTGASIPSNGGAGPASFTINVGTGGTATNGVIGLPTAPHGWSCGQPTDVTTASATVFMTRQIASTTTSATIANFNTAGAQAAWVASDILQVSCVAN